jgi:hypothetical protein
MSYTYPPNVPSVSGGNLTIADTHRWLSTPNLLARRLRDLSEQRFIADALLTGRYDGAGGGMQYEGSESLYTADNPQAVAAGSEYSKTQASGGTTSIAKTVKWGQEAPVTDEAIARMRWNAAERQMTKLVNQNVKYVDSVALSAISSAVTATQAAGAAWAGATAEQIITDVMTAQQQIRAVNDGFDPDTVVVDDLRWGYAMAKFIAAGLTPRESADTPLLTGQFPTILGLRWLATPNLPTANAALVVDSKQLGGMADEDLMSPGFVKVNGQGVEVRTRRDANGADQYWIAARRVTVPIVVEAAAARKITGVS